MNKAYCLLNHELTDLQIVELKNDYSLTDIIYPNEDIKKLWMQLPFVDYTKSFFSRILKWLDNTTKGDVLIIQGEFGATFALVDYCLNKSLIPIHSVTKRVAKERRDGEKVHREYEFEHIRFRRYKRFQDL